MYYFFDFKSSNTASANALDRFIITFMWKKGGSPFSEAWGKAMRAGVSTFSDIQLVTGIAILSAGFFQLNCSITSYHWQIIVYLAWFSSLTHAATMSLMHEYFRQNPFLRWLRITFMFVMGSLLIAALVPTGNAMWSIDGIPAQCFYNSHSYSVHSQRTSAMVFSVCFLLISYSTRAIKLFRLSSARMRYWLREKPGTLLKSRLDRLLLRQTACTKVEYRCLLIIIVLFRALYDIYGSIFWEVCPESLQSFQFMSYHENQQSPT